MRENAVGKLGFGTLELVAHLGRVALFLGHMYETLGVLVYYRLLPLYLVDELLGGYVRMSWKKLGPFGRGKDTEERLAAIEKATHHQS